jgi:hypothetical protein
LNKNTKNYRIYRIRNRVALPNDIPFKETTLPKKIGKKINKIISNMFNNNRTIKKPFRLHIRNIEIINLIAMILIIL